jgi:hypothetical protein
MAFDRPKPRTHLIFCVPACAYTNLMHLHPTRRDFIACSEIRVVEKEATLETENYEIGFSPYNTQRATPIGLQISPLKDGEYKIITTY